jgi:DnaA family protein
MHPPFQQNVLPLLRTKREFVFDTWITETNPKSTQWLQDLLDASTHDAFPILYLWGPNGSGLSHLAQACAQTLAQKKQSVFYLSLQEPGLSPSILDNLHTFDWIILDDIAPMLTHPDWQEPFIELYHHILHRPCKHLLLTHHCAPHHLTGFLFDTITRIQSALALKIDPLTKEDDLKHMLTMRIQFRQLNVSDRSIDFLLHHTERSAKGLITLLDQLEEQSLIQKRPISIPFIKAHLNMV